MCRRRPASCKPQRGGLPFRDVIGREVVRNLITDVPGLRSATPRTPSSPPASPRSCSTRPRSPSADVRGGAPGTRETDLLRPERDGRAHRRDRAVGRLGLRARCRRRRAGLAARAGPRLCHRQRPRADRAGRDPVRPAQRRRQGLGPLSALSRSWLRGRRECRRGVRARHCRRGLRRHHRQPQGRARLGLGARRATARRSARSSRSMRSAASTSATARTSGRRRSSRTASSAAAAFPRPCRRTRSRSA